MVVLDQKRQLHATYRQSQWLREWPKTKGLPPDKITQNVAKHPFHYSRPFLISSSRLNNHHQGNSLDGTKGKMTVVPFLSPKKSFTINYLPLLTI